MKNYFTLLLALFSIPFSAFNQSLTVSRENVSQAFPLVSQSLATPIVLDTADFKVVSIASEALKSDIKSISAIEPKVYHYKGFSGSTAIIVGTIGKSAIINTLVKSGKIQTDSIKNQWEAYSIQLVNNPLKGIDKALVIAGSDRRGTAYGIFELSRILGVSPWVWWADVKPAHSDNLFIISGRAITSSPSVKYRGIFLNDEDWGLKPWAARNMDIDIKDIGPKTYAHIFELLLRLKANFIWPAMHDCTKAFYYYPENPKVADRYAIVVGGSHCEPMLRNNVFEWKENFEKEYGIKPSDWRYDTNKEQIYRYWDDRLKVSSQYESVYTIGMRGIHDGAMPGPKDKPGKISLMQTVIQDQRQIFKNYLKSATDVPQIFCPYKEVLELYQGGLKLPDDVTIVWADDNHGYIRQLSNPAEQKRSGGSGVYYHISYWGAPHDYLWLSTASPALISYEMTKAYQFGANRLWVLNVGDIKPSEMETQFFLDLAWDVKRWEPSNAHNYSSYWTEQTFGKALSNDIAAIKDGYYRLSQNAKPEHLRMLHFNDDVKAERLKDWNNLVQSVEKVKLLMPENLQNAYYQLIEYPVKGNALMNQKVFFAEKSLDLAQKGDSSALEYSRKSQEAFEQIKALTEKYNTKIENGKWNGMMSYSPRNLPVYGMPPVATAQMVANPASITRVTKGKYIDNIEGASAEDKKEAGGLSIYASGYSSKHDIANEQVVTFDGLGLGGKSISRYPFNGPAFSSSDYNKAPYVEYSVSLKAGNYSISVKCLPTQAVYDGRGLRMAVSVNGQAPQTVNVAHLKEDAVWSANVLRGFSEAKVPVSISKDGDNVIRIYLLDIGLSVSKVDVTSN